MFLGGVKMPVNRKNIFELIEEELEGSVHIDFLEEEEKQDSIYYED